MTKSSSKVRKLVNKTITACSKMVHPTKKFFSNKPLKIISAAASVYREQISTKGYKASKEDHEKFAESQKRMAELMGLKTQDDGSFKKEDVDKILSPVQIIKLAGINVYRGQKEATTPFESIKQSVSEVFNNQEKGEKEDVPDELTAINDNLKLQTFRTDEDFLSCSEEDRNKYIESLADYPAEQDRLIKISNEKKEKNEKKHKAVDLSRQDYDTDSPHYGKDQDFSSKKGDIIDYMMDEIIMKGFDWVLNRVVNATTYLPMAAVYYGYHGLKDYLKHAGSNSGEKEQLGEVDKKVPQNNDFLIDHLNKHRAFHLEIRDGGFTPEMEAKIQDLIGHNTKVEDTDFEVEENGKKETFTLKKEKLEHFQKSADVFISTTTAARLDESLKGKDFDKNQLGQAVFEWIDKSYKLKDEGSKEKVEVPEYLRNLGVTSDNLEQLREQAEFERLSLARFSLIAQRMKANAEILAANYAQYKLLENARNPEGSQKSIDDIEVYMAEGRNIAYRVYQNQRQGVENTPSIESLIELSEQMVKNSTNLNEKSDQVTPSPDLIKEKLGEDLCKPQEKESLEEFSNNLTYDDVIKTEKNNLEALSAEYADLRAQKEDNDERRRKLEAFKKRMDVNKNQLNRLQTHVESKADFGQNFVDTSAFKYTPTDQGR